MFVDFNILNQLGSPSINSNTFANRPAAGQTGRLFVSTDTFEIYRDNGTGWDLIGGPGSSTVTGSGATGQVTYWTGTNTVSGENALFWDAAQNHLGINTATPTVALDVHSAADVALQLNGTGATPSIFQQFLSAGVSQYQVGYNWDASADYRRFSIYDSVGAKEVISIDQQSRYVGINYQYSSLTDQPAYTLDIDGTLRSRDNGYFATASGYVGINTTTQTLANSKLEVSGISYFSDNIINGQNGRTFPANGSGIFHAARTITVIDKHSFDCYSILNPTSGTFGYGVFDASTEWSSSNTTTNDHFQAYQARVYYRSQGNLTGTLGLAGFWCYNTHTGTGTVTNAYGLHLWDVGGTGTITNNYGIRIENVTRGSSLNYAIYSAGGNNYFGGSIGVATTRIKPSSAIGSNGNIAITTIQAGYLINLYYDASAGSWKYYENGAGILSYINNDIYKIYTAPVNSGGNDANATITERFGFEPAGNFYATGNVKGAKGLFNTTFSGAELNIGGAVVIATDQAGYFINTYYSGGFKYAANGYGYAMYLVSGNLGLYFAGNNTGGSGAAATLTQKYTFNSNGNFEATGSIKTAAPTTGTAGQWKLGISVADTVTLDTTQYIQLDIGGTLYKLAVVSIVSP